MPADARTRILLSAIDNALRNGSHMTGANYAFVELCNDLGVDWERLPAFEPGWIESLPEPTKESA